MRDEIRKTVSELSVAMSEKTAGRELKFMEVCGTHTVSIFRFGLRSLFPEGLEMLSGPGCPVCVTPAGEIDAFLEIAAKGNVTAATFGDLMRVPGSSRSLISVRGEGADVKVVYSPAEALTFAEESPDREIVFFGVGFETTIPSVAATVAQAKRLGLDNFSVFVSHRLVPPALRALLSDGEVKIDGLLCPGHVSAIIGSDAYRPFAEGMGVPCVIGGFEAVDIMKAVFGLAKQAVAGEARVENAYERAVTAKGNIRALEMIELVFEPCDAEWRGLGTIPGSGLKFRDEFAVYDAAVKFGVNPVNVPDPPGCRCGDILKGIASPEECPLFGETCTPLKPVGPCMVSSEGSCAAHYHYG